MKTEKKTDRKAMGTAGPGIVVAWQSHQRTRSSTRRVVRAVRAGRSGPGYQGRAELRAASGDRTTSQVTPKVSSMEATQASGSKLSEV